MGKKRVAVLISGRGSNLKALLDAAAAPAFPAEISLVISNVADAGGLNHAKAANVKTLVIDHKQFKERAAFDAEMHRALVADKTDFICLAGFMRLLSPEFTQVWHNKIVNIHPSLLPSFKGLDTHQRAIDAGVKFSGCTVHIVRPALDDGPILVQAACPVMADDTADKLAERILKLEHQAYPLALKLLAAGEIKIDGDKVIYPKASGAAENMINPKP